MQRDASGSLPERGSPDRRFGAERRLRRRGDFTKTFTGGIRLNARGVTLVVRPNGTNHPRLGLAVARRVVSRAVARHRLKRRIRESFRHNVEHLGGLDVVVLARPGIEKLESRYLRELLARQWKRAALSGRIEATR